MIVRCLPLLVVLACQNGSEPASVAHVPIAPAELPEESYERPPAVPPDSGQLVFTPENLATFYDVPGEAGFFVPGGAYGFDAMTIVVTETKPGGGPPLHTHDVEEAHILLSGTMSYVVGDRRFEASGPYIARVPAGEPHAFINAGASPLNLIGVLPSNDPGYEVIGPNPLVE